MDINSLISPPPMFGANKPLENTLNLKVGQKLDAKVIGADIQAAKNAITLAVGNKDITVQSSQPITLDPNQNLKIQVTQVIPVLEFKILKSSPELKAQDPNNQTAEIRLKVIATAKDGGSVASGQEPMRPTAKDGGSVASGQEPMRPTAKDGGSVASGQEPMRPTAKDSGSVASGKELMRPAVAEKQDTATLSLLTKQPIDVKIIGITGNKVQLQIFTASSPPPTTDTDNKQVGQINIDRSQLTNAPQNLKVGQTLSLEMIKAGTTPEFKVIPPSNNIPEAKVAEFIKQFLPRHEAPPLLLNQLIKDLPELMKNESLPKALKDIAAKIIQNLPPKEQLITSQGLKQSIANSGLFLEASLSKAELIKELPQLIKNETVPQSLQRIAAGILQNLTLKEPLPNTLSTANIKSLSDAELVALKLNMADIPKADALGAEDFKSNLLKFIHALKQEIATQGEKPINQTDIDLLKNLQNKTENTVAKLVLDQLMSLPREDNQKQLWVIDLPFIDRQQAETVKIEIQRDKENKQQSDSSDWSVNITITPPELGTIHCTVSYKNNVINTFFKSQKTQTTELIKYNLDYLKNQLEESGLTTGLMDAHDGSQKIQPPHQLAGKKLFDDKA
ncbi:MAG: flagellar hook-length control protein FliK [Methylobacter sp.]|nr:flagellar hook-length control protein FliK [Methylobacter sp.]